MITEKLICQETDRDGNIIDIWYCPNISLSKARFAAQTVYQEIIDKKFATTENLSTVLNRIEHIEVIYATTHTGEIINGWAFECRLQEKEAIVTLFFVSEEYRHSRTASLSRAIVKQHFYQTLISRGITKLIGWINVANTQALAAVAKDGWIQKEIRVVKHFNA